MHRPPATTPTERVHKPGWNNIHHNHTSLIRNPLRETLLIGDSIISGFSRYGGVWQKHFGHLNALNLGIGGDKTQHVLWRVQNYVLTPNIKYAIIHCGTNNLDHDKPIDIGDGILKVGRFLQNSLPQIKIIVSGLLPRDSCIASTRRNKIVQINKYLEIKCSNYLTNFYYLNHGDGWVDKNNNPKHCIIFQRQSPFNQTRL